MHSPSTSSQELQAAGQRAAALREELARLERFILDHSTANDAAGAAALAALLRPEIDEIFRGDVAAVLIDAQRRIVRASPGFIRLFGLVDPVGRQVDDALDSHFPRTATPWANAANATAWEQREVLARDGRAFVRRAIPIHAENAAVIGTVITFTPLSAGGTTEERFKLAVSSARLVWWDWDFVTGTISIYGDGGCLLGYSIDTLPRTAAQWFQLTHPDDLPEVQAAVEDCLAERTRDWSVEHRLRAADGQWSWVLNRGKLADVDQLGRATRMLGLTLDVHSRRSAEDNLRRDASILAQLHDAVICLDLAGTVTYWNDAATRKFGWESGEVVGCHHTERLASPEAKAAADALTQRARAGETIHGEGPDWRKDGSQLWVEYTFAPFQDRSGRVAGVVAVFRDITARKLAEFDLQRDARILAQLQDVVLYCDSQYRIVYVNEAFERVFGVAREAALGQEATFRLPPHAHAEIRAFQRRVLEGETLDVEWEDYRADGSRVWMQWRCQRATDADGRITGVINIATNIDARKRSEIERDTLQQQLIQAQRMETLGSLAGGIAHDFNNILAAIFGFTELALTSSSLTEQSRHYHQQVLKASERARELVKRILSFSRFHEPERRPVQLRESLEEAARFIRAALPSTVELELHLAADCPPTLADPHQLHQVVLNLATNAAHAIGPHKGRIRVSLTCTRSSGEITTATGALPPGEYAILAVDDTGHGMDPATQARIFEPFFTTKREGEGTGLGLSVVSAIVRGHGGGIAVRSTLGEGTTFTVYLPIVAGVRVAAISPDGAMVARMRARGETVAIIDDEEVIAVTTEKILQSFGYQASSYKSAEQFLQAFLVAPQGIDLIVTDQTMPRMTGLELVLHLRELGHTLPVLLMTGFSTHLQPEFIAAIRRAAVIKKPFDRLELARQVRALLDDPSGGAPQSRAST